MPRSIWSNETRAALQQSRTRRVQTVNVGLRRVELPTPFPSPADWRDVWIYQIVIDRFNNPNARPRAAWDASVSTFQGGTLNGVRARLDYLRDLGVGALWLSPVLKNPQYDPGSYHGYGIQDFLAIDPRLASDPAAAEANPQLVEEELRALVDEAHARGLYIIFDIVLNHTGDVFEYVLDDGQGAGMVDWRDDPPYAIRWRDTDGHGRADWTQAPLGAPSGAAIAPPELAHNEYFRRRGNAFTRPTFLQEEAGDFFTLKELATDYRAPQNGAYPVRDILIHAFQFLIAKFDVDGFRIDTLKYLEPDFALVFGNAIREYALSIGKKNFFTFGEVYDDEAKIAGYVGRNACTDNGDLVGVDAALDFPLFYKLPGVVKGFFAPSELVDLYERRKEIERGVLSSHGEASRYFVTFLDNHDQTARIYYSDPNDPHRYDDQVALAVGALFALQGVPCLYYGTEQGLHGNGGAVEAVREALWGKPDAFDPAHPFYRTIQQLAQTRATQPVLRYGRQYFRPLSGDGAHFGISTFATGVLAFSRILQDQEVVVVLNPSAGAGFDGFVIVDAAVNSAGAKWNVLFSNKPAGQFAPPDGVIEKGAGLVEVHEVNGTVTFGPALALPVHLKPLEIQVLGNAAARPA